MTQANLDKIKKLLEQYHDKTIILLNEELRDKGFEYVTLLNADSINIANWIKIPLAATSQWPKRTYQYLYLGIISEDTPSEYSSYNTHSINDKSTKIFWFRI